MADGSLKLPPGATLTRQPAAPKTPNALRLPPGATLVRGPSAAPAIGDLPTNIVKPAIDQAAANDAAQKQVVLDGAFAKFPALAKYKDKFVYTEMPGPDKRGQLESYPPWEGRNPNPGKHTIEMYNADATPQQKSDLVAGDMLHYMGAVDPTTGEAIDPGFRALKEQFIKSMTPRQLGMAQQRFAEEKAAGNYAPEVTFDQYLDMSHADEYLMGALTPDQGDYWRGRPGSHQKSVYSPEQDEILNQMRGYLAQGPDPEEEALKAQAKALPGALEQKKGFWENRLNDLKAGYLGMKSGMDINVGKNIRDIYRSRTKGFDAIDKGASLSDAQMITGGTLIDKDAVRLYQDSSTEDRAKMRAKMQVGGQGADVAAAQTALKTMGEADTAAGKTNPALSLALQAATAKRYDIAWDAFSQDPGGALASLITQSLPASGGAVVGGVAAGPIGIGVGSAGGEALSNLSGIVQSTAAKYGYDVSTPEGLIAFFDDKDAWAEAQGQSQTRAAVIGVFDAVTGHVAGAVMGPAARNIASAPLKAVTHAAGSSAIEGIGGAAGEATAEVATGQPLDPGQILAEGVGEVVPGIAEAAAAGVHAGKFKAPVTEVDLEAMERTQQAYRAQKAREAADAVARAEAAAKAAAAGAERARAEAAARDARAKAEQEQRKSQGKAGPNYQDKTWRGKFSSAPREAGADGRYHTDENGFVVSDKGGPIHFADNKTAARWILDVAQKQSPDQIFERANHPGQAGTTVQVTGIREAETTPEGEASGFASSNEEAKTNTGQEAPNSAAGEATLGGLPATAQAAAANTGAKNPESGGPFPGSKANPAEPETEADLHAAAANAASSPVNDHPEPTDAQKTAGNYRKAHIKIQGLEIAIENPKGSVRSGTSPDGSKWESQLPVHYGYIKRSEGADGDQVDVFVGDNPKSDKVWVIDQLDPKTGEFDENKAVMGVDSTMQALKAYTGSYSDNGARRIGAVTQMSVDEFKAWLKNGDTKKPAGNISTAQAKIKGTTAEVIDDAVPVEETPAASSAGAETPSQGKPEGFEGLESIPASQIGVDAKRFQFKEGGDEQGRLATLKGVKTWDKTKADIVSVWRDLAGRNLIGDGHQRLGLAHELEAGGHPPIDMLSRVYKESDGYKPADVMMIAAIKNIAQGTGSPMDAAKIFRRLGLGAGPLQNLPPRSALVQQGQALAKLGDEAFQLVVNGVVPANYAAVVGREIGGEKQQVAAMKILHKADPQSLQEADAIIQQIKAQGFEEKVNQGGLFGDEEIAESLVIERAKILSAALTELKRNRQLFNQLLKREDVARAAGNQLNTEANQQEKATHEQLLAIITKLANTKGPVSDALSAAARQLKAGKRIGAVAGDFLASVALQQSDEQRADRAGDAGPTEGRKVAEAPKPKVDTGPHLPGFEPTTKEAIAGLNKDERIKADRVQKPMDFGLFGDMHKQTDLEDGRKKAKQQEVLQPYYPSALGSLPGREVNATADLRKYIGSANAAGQDIHLSAARWVTGRGKMNGNEFLAAIDGDELLEASTTGLRDEVVLPRRLVARMNQPNADVSLHHNHPSENPLSDADLSLLVAMGVRQIVAYTPRGGIYMARFTPAARAGLDEYLSAGGDQVRMEEHILTMSSEVQDAVAKEMADRVASGGLDFADANVVLTHLGAVAMHNAGIIDYTAASADIYRLEAEIRKYLPVAEARLKELLKNDPAFAEVVAGSAHRSARPVQPTEAMAAIQRKPEKAAAREPAGEARDEAGEQGTLLPATGGRVREGKALEAPKPYFTASPNLNPQQAQQVQQGAVQIFDELNKPGVMGAVDRFFATQTRLWFDAQITGKRVQDIIEEKTGMTIPDIQDFYATEEGSRSRGADQMQQLDRKIVRPLIKAIKASGESLHDLEKYAYALHAEERNISIAAINTAMPDGGAGVLTADAQAHLASVTAEQKRRMQPAIDLIRELREFDLSMRVNYGLMDAGEAMRLLTEWPNYVPLQGREDLEGDEDRVHGGEGYSVRGPEFQVAKGRWSQPTNILGHMLAQAQTSILRGQANWVGQSLARLADAHPDDKFWEVDRVKYKRIIDKNTGLVRINYTAEQDPDHTIYYKVGGEPHRIWIQDRRWVSNLKKQRVNGIMQVLRLVRPFMHLLRLMIIAWNFEFLVSNLPRDIQTGMVQSLSYKVPKLRRRIVKNYMSSLMQGLLGAHGEDLGPWTKWMRRASAAGALSGNESASDVNAWRKNLAWETSRNPAVKAAKAAAFPIAKTLSGIERLNTGVEAAMRVATFRACVEGGLSDLQAASIAKNITVNFDRSGELGPYANALYLFFTATMGGGLTLVRAIKRRPGLIGAAGAALFLAGAAETLKFALQSGSDDDKDKKEAETYFALPDYAQERNIIYAQPKEDGPFKSVPLAYGLNVPYDAGKYAVMYALGKISGGEFFSKLFDSTMHSFSPLDVDRGWPAVLPSVGQPFGDVAQNESWSGKPINPDKHGKPIPDSENTYAGVPDAYKKFAKGLNEAAGGSDVESSGVFDISPGSMEYIIEQFTGGVGNMANRILRVREKIESGEEIEASDLPIARKYFVTSAKTVMREKFYEISNHLEDLDSQRDALRKKRREADDGDPKKAAQARIDAFELEHKDELGYLHEARRQRNKFDRLRKDAKKVDDDKSLTEAQKRKSKGVIFDQMNALALDMVRSYNRDVLVPLQSSRAWIKITPKGVELNR